MRQAIMAVILFTIGATASATTLNFDTAFTLRSKSEQGPAEQIDASWNNNGFDGFLSSAEGLFVDHSLAEFDISSISTPVSSATLNWTIDSGFASDTVYIDSYLGDGNALFSDWILRQGLTGLSNAAKGAHSIDITSDLNSFIGSSHIGFSFAIDAHPFQALFNGNAITIEYTASAVPVPTAIWLMGSGLLGLIGFSFKNVSSRDCRFKST